MNNQSQWLITNTRTGQSLHCNFENITNTIHTLGWYDDKICLYQISDPVTIEPVTVKSSKKELLLEHE